MFSGEIRRPIARFGRAVIAAVVAGAFLAGCAADDVEFNGKLFELAGLNNVGKKGSSTELVPRTGLVVPPDLNKLPDPDKPVVVNHADAALDLINDPDRAKVVSQEELERRQIEACKPYELAKMRGEAEAELIEGPLGPCRKSVLTAVGGWMNSK